MRVNKAVATGRVSGAIDHSGQAQNELARAVASCLLWEDQFYESGVSITDRIKALGAKVPLPTIAAMAVSARTHLNLRHAPLLLVNGMFDHPERPYYRGLLGDTIHAVVQRPDELGELLALWWKDGKRPIPNQMKKGLAAAFGKFKAETLAKYDRKGDAIKLRDVLRLVHPKPQTMAQSVTYGQLAKGTLPTPDTWEVALSAGADKRATFSRLILERQLGGLAFLRNLRNMAQAGVPQEVIDYGFSTVNFNRVLPFRFIAAARFVPQWEEQLEAAMFRTLEGSCLLSGKTAVLVDVSGSMDDALSAKSDMRRLDAACGLAMVLRELCEKVEVTTFSTYVRAVPPRRGFALRDAIVTSQKHNSTDMRQAILAANQSGYDRIVVVTDEQSQTGSAAPLAGTNAYILNVASYRNGIGSAAGWTTISGFSEACVRFIQTIEGGDAWWNT